MAEPGLPTLVVHIGHGKTGTSSIQWTLEENRAALEVQGVAYLGYMLEHCRLGSRIPRVRLGEDLFAGHNASDFAATLFDVLMDECREARSRGARRLIWSNESILPRAAFVVPALSRLRDAGVPVRVLYYVRRHDAWAQSAYFQWGIRHKTYVGPVRPFRDWVAGRSIAYHPPIRPWIKGLGADVRVFNFDAIDDVVAHFLTVNGATVDEAVSVNEGRSSEELLIWAAFNSRYEEPVQPDRLEPLFEELDRSREGAPTLSDATDLFPGQQDLAAIRAARQADAEAVNRILTDQGEPPLDLSGPIADRTRIDAARLARTLFRLFVVAYGEASGEIADEDRVIPRRPVPVDPRLGQLEAEAAAARRSAVDLAERVAALEAELATAQGRPFRNAWRWARARLRAAADRAAGGGPSGRGPLGAWRSRGRGGGDG